MGVQSLSELNTEIRKYFEDPGPQIEVRSNSVSGHKFLSVVFDRPIPLSIPHRATDALQRFKDTFDQTIYGAGLALGAVEPRGNFPWARNPKNLDKRLTDLKIPDAMHSVIWEQELYWTGEDWSGGNDFIRDLVEMANERHTVNVRAAVKFDDRDFCLPALVGNGDCELLHSSSEPIHDPDSNSLILMAWKGDGELVGDFHAPMGIYFDSPKLRSPIEVCAALRSFRDAAARFLGDAEVAIRHAG